MKDYREAIAFPVLDVRHIERLRKIGTSCEFGDGETLFAEGDRGFDFFVVEEGQVEILEHSAGRASTITIHEAESSPATWTC
jgi:thioredoxin reductase (NADPH)